MTTAPKAPNYTGLEIAVTGMACEFPGASNLSEFWQNLKTGTEGIKRLSREELLARGLSEEEVDDENFVPVDGFLQNKEYFDNHFFNFTPHEVKVMDPQTRVFFQTAWHALEDAGLVPDQYKGKIGLFAGARDNPMWQAYASIVADRSKVDSFSLSQLNNKEFIPTMLSYRLNLRGPAVYMTTACSTSLVALHQACRALLLGDADVCLAGGVSVASALKPGYYHQEGMIMSGDGYCRAFDAESDGTVGGEGSAVVVLKKLKDAIKDGDHIYAVVKGSAINNDGNRKVGYTAPSIDGQVDCIRRAHAVARVAPASISYIEAHGTATKLGDPIELQALNQVFAEVQGQTCALGSVKTTVGHTGVVAGIAGFIKTVLAVKNRTLPPSLHYQKQNPEVPFEEGPFEVVKEARTWEAAPGEPLRAGVSSFGIGGTNAHVVLEEAPAKAAQQKEQEGPYHLFISGRNQSATLANREALADYLRKNPEVPLADISHTLWHGRKHFNYRTAVAGKDSADLMNKLQDSTIQLSKGRHPIYFMCTGQGSQYHQMCLGLYEQNPRFREQVDHGFALAARYTERPLRQILYGTEGEAGDLHALANSLPVMYIIQHAIAQLLQDHGIRPDKVIGHSSGEYVAASLAGIIGYEDGLRLIIKRSQLMQSAAPGTMMSVPMSEEELQPLLGDQINLVAVNTDSQCVVGGTEEAIEKLRYKLEGLDYDCRLLKSSHAAHSFLMEPILDDFYKVLQDIELKAPAIPLISNYTGKELSAAEATDPHYWCKHLRHTVRFAAGAETLLAEEQATLIEIGPGRALCTFVRQHPARQNQPVLQAIRHPQTQEEDQTFFANLLDTLWSLGAPIDMAPQLPKGATLTPLPGYHFDKLKYPVVADQQLIREAMGVTATALGAEDNEQVKLYTETWQQIAALAPRQAQKSSLADWLLLIADKGDAQALALATSLRNTGADVTLAWRSTQQTREGEGDITFDTQDPAAYTQVMHHLQGKTGRGRIICFAATDQASPSMPFFDLSRLLKTIEGIGIEDRLALDIITRQAHGVTGAEQTDPQQAMVYGFYKVMSQEYTDLPMRLIDISLPQTEPGSTALLEKELLNGDEKHIALRNGRRWQRDIAHLPHAPVQPQQVAQQGGFAIITGAPGGMAQVMATYLGKELQMKIGLIGRSALSDSFEEALKEHAIDYTWEQADMGDQQALSAAISKLTDTYGREVSLLIHTAGIGDYAGLLMGREEEESYQVLAPKVEGTRYLLEALAPCEVDKMVFCSSRATEMAPVGQVAYIAANEYLNAIASQPGDSTRVTIAWEAWREIGMAIKSRDMAGKDDDHLSHALSNTEAMEVMLAAIHSGQPHVISSRKNLHALLAEYRSKLAQSTGAEDGQAGPAKSRDELKSGYVAPANEVEEKLVALWEDFFGMEGIGVKDDFFDLGGDSLKLMRMHKLICAAFDVKFELVELFIHFKISAIADFLIKSGQVSLTESDQGSVETLEF